jgi:hypothetical protein
MITQTIRVTAEHIRLGKPEQCTSCPIALAILDAFPGITGVAVNPGWATAYRGDDDPVLDAFLPKEASQFIDDFDDLLPVTPFEFQVTWLTAEEELTSTVAGLREDLTIAESRISDLEEQVGQLLREHKP